MPADVLKLTEWVSDYYLAGPGATLSAALPPHGLTARRDRFKTVRVVALTAAALDEFLPKMGARQRAAIEVLRGSPEGLPSPQLAERGVTAATITRFKSLGLISIREERVDRDPFEHAVSAIKPTAPREATAEQQQALNTLIPLAASRAFHVALVHGVTGSGKTEVYLRLAEVVRKRGRGVLMLVPEIALTPQVAALFRARFGAGGGHPAQRPVGRRAPRSVASHPARRRRRGDRHAVGGVRAAEESRADHRRRGTRHLLQAG